MDISKQTDPLFHPADRLKNIVVALRGKNGCPWDIKQTPQTLKKYLLEETRELAEAIDESNPQHICEEIGDVYFILTLLTLLFEEENSFTADDTWDGITQKMIRRHPHVFAGQQVSSEEELNAQWEQIKKEEKT